MKILVINGSPREKSRSRAVTNHVVAMLQASDIDVTYIDLGTHILPLYSGRAEDACHPAVVKLSATAMAADGFFIITPEYHNGMSGVLKNALDFLGGEHFKGKPVAIAAACGGGKGGINALNNLRVVMRGLYGFVLPDQYVVDPPAVNSDYVLIGEANIARVNSLVEELVRITVLLSQKDVLTLTNR